MVAVVIIYMLLNDNTIVFRMTPMNDRLVVASVRLPFGTFRGQNVPHVLKDP